MNIERDKFLTEVIGECWHGTSEAILDSTRTRVKFYCCNACHQDYIKNNDFSTWEGFGKLWEWAQRQEWWLESGEWLNGGINKMVIYDHLINPDRFANSIYSFLRAMR